MRITNSMMIGQLMSNLNKNLKRMETYHHQLATGRSIVRPSQDPMGITRSLQARTELSKIADYLGNVDDSKAWLTQTETALTEMNSLITRAYELAVDASNASKKTEDRAAISKEVGELMDQLLEASNSAYSGRYTFGGYNTTERPFEVKEDGADTFLWHNGQKIANLTNPDAQPIIDPELTGEKIEFEVGSGVLMEVSLSGLEVLGMGDDNLYAVFNELFQALNDEEGIDIIGESIGKLQKKQGDILSQLAEVGGRINRLDLIKSRLEADELNYTAIKSRVEDVDHEKVIMEFLMAEMVYRSSLSAGARIIQPTLIDFLR